MGSSFKIKTNYKRCTRKQLASLIQQYQRRLYFVARAAEWQTFGGKTRLQHGRVIKKHLKNVSKYLRSQILAEIDWKIRFLTAQMALRYGVPRTSKLATSAAIRRLKLKRRQIEKCVRISTLIMLARGLKLANFKNPKVSKRTVSKRRLKTHGRRRTSGRRRPRLTKKLGFFAAAKYKFETNKLKREIKGLKDRNAFLRKQVVKFRQEAARMQKHYSTLNRTAPRWTVVKGGKFGKDVSNIVRISNALTNAIEQRKAV